MARAAPCERSTLCPPASRLGLQLAPSSSKHPQAAQGWVSERRNWRSEAKRRSRLFGAGQRRERRRPCHNAPFEDTAPHLSMWLPIMLHRVFCAAGLAMAHSRRHHLHHCTMMTIPPIIAITTDWLAVAPVYAGVAPVFVGLLVQIWHIRALMADNERRQTAAAWLDAQRRRQAEVTDEERRAGVVGVPGPPGNGMDGMRGLRVWCGVFMRVQAGEGERARGDGWQCRVSTSMGFFFY